MEIQGNKVLEMLKLCEERHAGQIDQNGKPMIEHCIRVMNTALVYPLNNVLTYPQRSLHYSNCSKDEFLCIALGHDLLEDTTTTFEELQHLFGDKVAMPIKELTKIKENQDYMEYIKSIQSKPAMLIKLCDLTDNMANFRVTKPYDKYVLRMQRYESACKYLVEKLWK